MSAAAALQAAVTGGSGRLLFVTGAGISAESGIPTFRGPEGYWREGSKVYHPMELATQQAYVEDQRAVWRWYLHRRAVCEAAEPNPAHFTIARAQAELGSRCGLVTQNVDGLHRRAGSREETTWEIHGDIGKMRCFFHDFGCANGPRQFEVGEEQVPCPECGEPMRPHILWFDESYSESLYHFDTVLAKAARADAIVFVGTTLETALPDMVMRIGQSRGALLIDVNVERSRCSDMVEEGGGHVLLGPAAEVLPPLVEAVLIPEGAWQGT